MMRFVVAEGSRDRVEFVEPVLIGARVDLPSVIVLAGPQRRWSSLWRRTSGTAEQQQLLSAWPVAYPRGWCKLVNEPQTEAEVDAIRRCVARGEPYGGEEWVDRTAKQLGLESTLRATHRPRKITGNQ